MHACDNTYINAPLEVVAQIVAQFAEKLASAVAAAAVGARAPLAPFAFVAGEARAVAGLAVAHAAARALPQRVGSVLGRGHVHPGNLVRALPLVTGPARLVAVAPVVVAHAPVGRARAVARTRVGAVAAVVQLVPWGRGGGHVNGVFRLPTRGEGNLNGGDVDGAVAR